MITPVSPTRMQRDALLIIQELFDAEGVMPSRRAIARELCVNPGSAQRVVDGLIERGWLRRDPRRSHGLQILHRIEPLADVPIELLPAGAVYAATFHGKQS